jgi:catechol 2,3-dioxygenase-like lactoylglutathione lyase family enzyme
MPEAWMAHVAVSAAELRLDHVSIEVPDFADAVDRLDERLGLRVTVSPQAPERHGRILLDRAYLEVAAHPGSPTWTVGSFFLRFSDLEELRAYLEGARLRYRYRVYEGVDGRWDDIELDVADVPVPILVRRTEPAQVARNWPPALDQPHRCGAFMLAAVHLPVASIEAGADVYVRLLNVEAPPALTGPGPGRRRRVFHLGSARIMLVEDGERRAVVLGVASLETSRAVLSSELLPPDDGGIAWLHPSATSDLAVGLVEAVHDSVPDPSSGV